MVVNVLGLPVRYEFLDDGEFSFANGFYVVQWSSIPEDFGHYSRFRDLLHDLRLWLGYA